MGTRRSWPNGKPNSGMAGDLESEEAIAVAHNTSVERGGHLTGKPQKNKRSAKQSPNRWFAVFTPLSDQLDALSLA